ncbi:general odorant-binding protein 28a-like [Arctopsyche grandis]|uniref:general odorant-binding protein 28a-like n=1 Tax=Arctopsyche grandis TaxID=121162 RepID=UPI00406D84A0
MNKVSIVALCLVAAALPAVNGIFDKDKFMAIGAKCKEENKTPDEEVQKILNKEPATTPEAKCMMACIFKEMGILTADGKFDAEANEKAAQEAFKNDEKKVNRAKEFSDYCKDRVNAVEDDEKGCERAGVMHACAMEKVKELGLSGPN